MPWDRQQHQPPVVEWGGDGGGGGDKIFTWPISTLDFIVVQTHESGWVVTWFLFGYTVWKNVKLNFHNIVLSESK